MALIYNEAESLQNQRELKAAFADGKAVVYLDTVFGFINVIFIGGVTCMVSTREKTEQKDLTIEAMAALIGNNYRYLIGN